MSIAVIVLAAGRGERMGGVCKAGLKLPDGRSFARAIVAAARAAWLSPVIVVGAAPWLEETRIAAGGVDLVVENPAPDRGMASSFAVGLAALDGRDCSAALAWPVDHPLVLPATVKALVAKATRARAVVPMFDGRGGHPTVFGAELWPACIAAAGEPHGLRTVLHAGEARVIRLTVDDPGVRRDVDTPDDYAKMKGE